MYQPGHRRKIRAPYSGGRHKPGNAGNIVHFILAMVFSFLFYQSFSDPTSNDGGKIFLGIIAAINWLATFSDDRISWQKEDEKRMWRKRMNLLNNIRAINGKGPLSKEDLTS